MSLSESHVEVLTPNVLIFGDGAFKEVTKVKLSHKGGTLI